MSRKTLVRIGWGVLILIIIGVLVLTGYYIRSINNQQVTPVDSAITEQEKKDGIVQSIEDLIEQDDDLASNPSNQTAVLESLRDNGSEFAVAVRSYDAPSGKFTIEFIGTIGDPQPGNTYEALVTDGEKTHELGVLTKDVENTYTLSYSDTKNITGLDEIIVIEAGSSEQDVMKGIFEQ